MASYTALYDLASDDVLRNKIAIACTIAADAIRTELATTTNHVNRLKWAKACLLDPQGEARRMIWALLAANNTATTSAITGASDATIQTAVNNAVDVFADGL